MAKKDIEVKAGSFYLVASTCDIELVKGALIEIRDDANQAQSLNSIVPPEVNRWDWAIPLELRKRDFINRVCDIGSLAKLKDWKCLECR